MCLFFIFFFELILYLTGFLINQLNKTSDTCSFYVCMRIMMISIPIYLVTKSSCFFPPLDRLALPTNRYIHSFTCSFSKSLQNTCYILVPEFDLMSLWTAHVLPSYPHSPCQHLNIHHLLERLVCYEHVLFFLSFQKEACFLRGRHGTKTKTSSLIAWCPLHSSLQFPFLGWVMPSQIFINVICLLERQNGALMIRRSLHE